MISTSTAPRSRISAFHWLPFEPAQRLYHEWQSGYKSTLAVVADASARLFRPVGHPPPKPLVYHRASLIREAVKLRNQERSGRWSRCIRYCSRDSLWAERKSMLMPTHPFPHVGLCLAARFLPRRHIHILLGRNRQPNYL